MRLCICVFFRTVSVSTVFQNVKNDAGMVQNISGRANYREKILRRSVGRQIRLNLWWPNFINKLRRISCPHLNYSFWLLLLLVPFTCLSPKHEDRLICVPYNNHYSGVIMAAMVFQITSLTIITQPLIQAQIKENINAPRYQPLCENITDDRWIPRTKGQ